MNITDLIQRIRDDLARVRKSGISTVAIPNLDAYLVYLQSLSAGDPDQLDTIFREDRHAEHELRIAALQTQTLESLESFRSIMSTAQEAIKVGLLINGGAAVALLAFLGHLVSTGREPVGNLAYTLLFFGLGVLCAGVVSLLAYVTQRCYGLGWTGFGNTGNIIAVVIGMLAHILFLVGVIAAFIWFMALP